MKLFVQKHIEEFITKQITTKRGLPRIMTQVKYYYPLHKLIHESVFVRDRYNEGVGLKAETLSYLFGKGKIVKQVLEDLERWKFIIKVKDAKLGENCAKYKLHPSIERMKVRALDFDGTDAPMIRKLEEKNAELRKSFKGQLEILENYITLNQEGIDYLIGKYGDDFYEDDVEMERRDLALKKIYNKEFFAVRPDKNSRVYTNISSLYREFRKFILFDGKPIINIDVKNSQILLIVPLLQDYWRKHRNLNLSSMPTDCFNFKKDAESGVFYEVLSKAAGIVISKDEWRDDFKKQFYKENLFSKNYPKLTPLGTTFKELYPNVHDIIRKLKQVDHRLFSVNLQRKEASIIIDGVWRRMYEEGRLALSIHDSILVNCESDLDYATYLMKKEFFKYGIVPSLKAEIFDEFGTVLLEAS